MNHKIKIIGIATIVGVCVGATLGFGPLQRYKSDGVLSMELGTSEYKRITELANDPVSIRQYLNVSPPLKVMVGKSETIVSTVVKGEWHKPLPKVSKGDAKELPDVVLLMERDREKDKDKDKDKDDKYHRKDDAVYFGLRIANTAHEPVDAMDIAIWLGDYFKEVATREAVRELLSNWAADNQKFSNKALEQQFKYKFEIEQAELRANALKKLVASYPDATLRENRQVVDVRKDNEKFMSPMAQLVGAESQIIDIKVKLFKLTRQIEQHSFLTPLIELAEQAVKQANSGSESVNKLVAVIEAYSKKVKTDAEREIVFNLAADLSHISARFLSQAHFIALPTLPVNPERPTPLMYTALVGLLFALVAVLYCWRKELWNMLHDAIRTN
jgi:Isy1-like splicing family